MIVAALDLGSNSFLCLIAEIDKGKIIRILHDEVRVVRLGQGLTRGNPFHPEALKRADKCLKSFSEAIKKYSPDLVIAAATAAARNASNADGLIEIGKRYSIPIKIIPGSQEASITYEGGLSGIQDDGHFVVIDIGGGSTEVIYGTKMVKHQSKSFDFGVVKLTEKFIRGAYPVSEGTVIEIKKEIELMSKEWISQLSHHQIDRVIAVAGTPTAIAMMDVGGVFDVSKIEGFRLDQKRLGEWSDTLAKMSPQEIHLAYGLEIGRADVIVPGVIILKELLRFLGKDQLEVSTRGVRFGVALAAERGEL